MLDIDGKCVLVAGAGISGISAAKLLKHNGARVTVSDVRPPTSIPQLNILKSEGLVVEAGSHGLLTFCRNDWIVLSPGVPITMPEVVTARTNGTRIIGEIELGSCFLRGKMIAVTGSNGKTTTSSLLEKILKNDGKRTLLGGNIGIPLTNIVSDSNSDTWSVIEVSSFQLETIETFRPHVAIVLNVTPDHLDRHLAFEAYVEAKSNITKCQTMDDYLILNREDRVLEKFVSRTKAQTYFFSSRGSVEQGVYIEDGIILFRRKIGSKSESVMPVAEIGLAGSHNVDNVMAAVCASRLAGVAPEVIRQTVASFKAVEHRLELVREVKGVRYFNDSKATNVDATAKALEAFSGGIWLVLGGKDKESDYTVLAPLLHGRVKAVITIGSAADKIGRQLEGVVKIERAETLERAVAFAYLNSKPDDVVLLAPACSSFDQFESYEHRGRVFKKLVAGLN